MSTARPTRRAVACRGQVRPVAEPLPTVAEQLGRQRLVLDEIGDMRTVALTEMSRLGAVLEQLDADERAARGRIDELLDEFPQPRPPS